jgi:hypothetical protein
MSNYPGNRGAIEYLIGLVAIVLLYCVLDHLRAWRRRAASRGRFIPHVTANGRFICFAVIRRQNSAE